MSTRVWFAREAQFTADPKVQVLGHEHGPAGPLVVEEIFALAKLAEDGGCVSITYAMLAGRAFTTPSKARDILRDAVELGLVEFVDNPGPKGCALAIPKWRKWQVKDPTAALRQSRRRHGDVTRELRESHAKNRDIVVTRHAPTETETETASSLRSLSSTSQAKFDRSRQVVEVFDEWVAATERAPGRTRLTPDRRRRIDKAIASHGLDDCLAAVRHIGADSWARGANDRGRRFDDIAHALGSTERLERWRDQQPGRQPAPELDYRQRRDELVRLALQGGDAT